MLSNKIVILTLFFILPQHDQAGNQHAEADDGNDDGCQRINVGSHAEADLG